MALQHCEPRHEPTSKPRGVVRAAGRPVVVTGGQLGLART